MEKYGPMLQWVVTGRLLKQNQQSTVTNYVRRHRSPSHSRHPIFYTFACVVLFQHSLYQRESSVTTVRLGLNIETNLLILIVIPCCFKGTLLIFWIYFPGSRKINRIPQYHIPYTFGFSPPDEPYFDLTK